MTDRDRPSHDSLAEPSGRSICWAAIGVPLVLYLLHVLVYIRHVNDDAFITFRYGRFLATGLGPYFNVGEHVEGYTNFLHMLLMAAAYAVGGENAVPPFAKAVGIAAGALALVLAFFLARTVFLTDRRSRRHASMAGGLAAATVAVFPGFALNSTSGLETTLFGMLVTLGVYLGVVAENRGRWHGAGLAWAAAALTRPEGMAVFGAYWLCGFLAQLLSLRTAQPDDGACGSAGRRLALDAGIVVIVLAAHFGFRFVAYDGELLPNTFFAKAAGFSGYTPWEYVRHGALRPFLGLVGVIAGLAGWWRARLALRLGLPMVGVAVFGALLPFLVGSDWMPGWRFSVPYLALLGATVSVGWVRILRPALDWAKAVPLLVSIVLVAGLAAWNQAERQELADLVRLRAEGYATGHRALARWLHDEAARPGDTVALMDIGIVGYYCPDLRILDITGLTDRFIAKRPGRLLAKQYDPAYVLDQRPEFIVLVLSALGEPRAPLPENAEIGTWIRIEAEILVHPDFRARYVRDRVLPDGRHSWTERLAARLGAERVFEHAFPGQYYLLAVFQRQDSP